MADETRILVLEGPLSRGVADLLAAEGWSVTPTTSSSELLAALEGEANLIVLSIWPKVSCTFHSQVTSEGPVPETVPTRSAYHFAPAGSPDPAAKPPDLAIRREQRCTEAGGGLRFYARNF